MSSESLSRDDINLYMWRESLNIADYVEATYYIETLVDPELAAVAMAREQSASTAKVPSIDQGYDLSPYTARVTSVESLGETMDGMLPAYRLNTAVYQTGIYREKGYGRAKVKIAFPVANFGRSLVNLWNAIGAELYRLGFLNAIKLLDITFPKPFLDQCPGPLHGAPGIKSQLRITDRPIFCRSARPAVGLTTEMMLKINENVLRGGFDVVKDDELTCDTPLSPFMDRIKRMVNLVRRMEDETGERKYYIANIIDDPSRTIEFAEAAVRTGVDALLVSPPLQGFIITGELARRTGLPVLCHCSWEDILTRHPRFGISRSLYLKMQRLCGADMVILPGNFATGFMEKEEAQECITACMGLLGNIKPSLPIIAGGKSPEGLPQYLRAIGSTDFMIIAATAVDNHPEGVEAGARAFREAFLKMANEKKSTSNSIQPYRRS